MARSVDEVVRDMLGNLDLEMARTIAENERLRERVAELEAQTQARVPAPAVTPSDEAPHGG